MKKAFIFLFLLVFSFAGKAQFAVNYYYDGNTLGISTSPEKATWFELRMNTVSYIFSDWSHSQRGIPQAYFCYKLVSDSKVSLYSGAGIGVPIFEDGVDVFNVNIPIGLQSNPISSMPKLYLTAEYNPMVDVANDMHITSTLSVGFRYVFGKKKL